MQSSADAANARVALDHETGAYVLAARLSASPARLDEFARKAREHRQRGMALLQTIDRRRNVEQEYRAVIESIGGQIQASSDHSWKFMGRQVTRPHIVELQGAMQDLRLRSERLLAARSPDDDALQTLEASIGRFSSVLDAHSSRLVRDEGAVWFGQLQSGIGHIRSLGQRLGSLDRSRSTALTAFQSAGFTLASDAQGLHRQDQPADRLAVAASYRMAGVPVPRPSAVATRPRLGIWLLSATGAVVLSSLLLIAMRRRTIRDRSAHARSRVYRRQLESERGGNSKLQQVEARDPLTKLPNRRELMSYLQAMLEQAGRAGERIAVLLIDLDNFKILNDSVSHEFGDRVLVRIAEQVSRLAGPTTFVARPGGDEFAIVHQVGRDGVEPAEIGRRLLHSFTQSVPVDDRKLSLSISVGAAIYPDHAGCADALLSAADAAVFHAKASGRGRLSVFHPPLLEAASTRFRIEQGLRHAIERNELELVYQPEVSARNFHVSALEALVRWRLPDGTLVLPGQFLAVAEESGLICDIGHWVLRRAIETAALWHRSGEADVLVAINVSARQLLESGFVAQVTGLLAAADLPAKCIELELTENALQTGRETIEVLQALHAAGIAVALDDFGTGYSCLGSLEQLPLSRVKLDRSLIAGLHTSARSRAIAKSIAGLCRKLGLQITAEGIEHMEQLSQLLPEKAMHLQGFLIGKPVDTAQVPALVAAMPRHMATLLRPALRQAVPA